MSSGEELKQRRTVEPAELDKSELGFVTSIHLPTRTFFVQLCKNTLEQLGRHDETINDYCIKIEQGLLPRPEVKKIHSGDYVCAKYLDGRWYRSLVLDRNRATRTCSLQMIDYGNFQVLKQDEVIPVDADTVPDCFWRQPFGVQCSILDTFKVDQDVAIKALNCLHNKYLLINILGQQTPLHYIVDVPKVCYNMPFWDQYDPSVAEILRKDSHRGSRAIEMQEDEASLDEESLDEGSVGMFPGL